MKKVRQLSKRLLSSNRHLYRATQWIYHETKFALSRLLLISQYKGLRVVRYSASEIESQRALGFRSQFGQDYYVYNSFFQEQRSGYFLDIGCNQPEYLNNTFCFETQMGWSGLAFDPISRYGAEWKAQRKALFMPVALGADNAIRSFVEIVNKEGWADMMSAFADKARVEDLQYGHRIYDVSVRRASDVLSETDVTRVDFASIDVEGAELEVLAGLNFELHSPRVLLIENNSGLAGDSRIRAYLKLRGYKFYARIWTTDDVFLRAA